VATWNVNSLKARLERVVGWLERARPDVLLLQETKLADDDVPREAFERLGYRSSTTARDGGTAWPSPAARHRGRAHELR
jgi:exonuclease III